MQLYDVINRMIGDSGMTVYAVEKARDKGNYLNRGKSRGSILKCNLVSQTAEICGYKLALVPRESVTAECLTIDPEQEVR